MTRNLRNLLFFGIFAVLFIPLIGSNSLAFPFVTGKAFAFRILIELLAGIWLLLVIADKKYRPKFSWLIFVVLVFTGVIAIADVFGVNPSKSIWGDFERMDGLINILHLVVYFMIAGTLLMTERHWNNFLNTTLGVSVLLSFIGLLQLAGATGVNTDAGRLDATIGNAAFFAAYLLLHIFIAFLQLVRSMESNVARWIYASMILLQTVVLYFTATRAAILGLIGGIFVAMLLVAFLERSHKMLRRVAIGTILIILVFISGFVFLKDQSFIRENPILNRYTVISLEGIKDQPRYYLWLAAVEGFKDRPVFGWGQENYHLVLDKHYNPALYNSEIQSDRAHNIIFDWLVAGGILGLLGYLSIYIVALYYLWSSNNSELSNLEKSILTGLFAGYFINNLFVFDTLVTYIIFFGILAYIHFLNTCSEEGIVRNKDERKLLQQREDLVKKLIIPISIVTILGAYLLNARAILSAAQFAPATFFYSVEPETSLAKYQKALSYDSFSQEKIRQSLVADTINLKSAMEVSSGVKEDYYELALSEMKLQIQETPKNSHNLYLLGSLLFTYGKYDEALVYLEKSRELSPNKQVILLRIVDIYVAKEDYKNALKLARHVFELDPNYDFSRIMYATALVYMERSDDASTLLTEKFGTDTLIDSNLIYAYAKAEEYNKLIEIYKKQILQNPGDIQSRVSLSVAYIKIGDPQAAIMVIREAITQDPSLEEMGKRWIKEIQAGRMPQ